jgi:hypothetical protein
VRTCAGESSGGISTCTLALSPAVGPDLFQRAIVQSGPCVGQVRGTAPSRPPIGSPCLGVCTHCDPIEQPAIRHCTPRRARGRLLYWVAVGADP